MQSMFQFLVATTQNTLSFNEVMQNKLLIAFAIIGMLSFLHIMSKRAEKKAAKMQKS